MDAESIVPTLGTPEHRVTSLEDLDGIPRRPLELSFRLFPPNPNIPDRYIQAVDSDRGTFDYFESPESALTRVPHFLLWIYTFTTAVLIGLIKGAVTVAARKLWSIRLDEMSVLSQNHDNTVWLAMVVYLAIALASGATSSLFTVFFAPASAGGGIPDIKAFLNGNLIPGFLANRTLLGRLIGIALVTSCGVMAGPEGPMSHGGLIIGVIVPGFIHKFRRNSQPFTDKQVYDFATVGSGMGIAAAFNAPLAGTLFALEEAASYWHTQLISRTFFGCLVAAIVGTYTTAGFQCDGISSYCVSVSGEFALSQISLISSSFQSWEIPIFAIAGLFSSILALTISYGIFWLQKFRLNIYKRNKWFRILDVLIVFSFTPILFSIASLASPCSVASGSSETTISSSLCRNTKEINPIAFVLLEDRSDVIASVFSQPFDSFLTQSSLAISGAFVLLTTIITSGLSVPAGLFIPMVMTGSLFGRLFGIWVHLITGATSVAPGIYAIATAAGVLAGVSRMYIWIGAVMLEACSDLNMTIPIILTVVVSNWVSDLCMRPALYERIIEEKGIHFLPPGDDSHVVESLSQFPIKRFMSQPAVCFRQTERKYTVAEILRFSPYSVYPVVDEIGRLRGTTRRKELEEIFAKSPDSPVITITVPISSNPIAIPENFDALKCYYFFTQLGTKLIVVIDEEYRVVGVVTRRNFKFISS